MSDENMSTILMKAATHIGSWRPEPIDLEDGYFSIIGWAQSPIAGQPMWCAQQKPPVMYPLPSIKVSGAAHRSAVA